MIDDYDMEAETLYLLKIFRDGGEQLEKGGDWQQYAKRASDYLHTMSNRTKGCIVIDLLVLASELERNVIALKVQQMEGTTDGQEDDPGNGTV
jgi:hypothetical protein